MHAHGSRGVAGMAGKIAIISVAGARVRSVFFFPLWFTNRGLTNRGAASRCA
jgi:hypothetical protein